jgi:hypothetical protein
VRCGDVVRVRLYERRRRAGEAAGLAGQWHGGACGHARAWSSRPWYAGAAAQPWTAYGHGTRVESTSLLTPLFLPLRTNLLVVRGVLASACVEHSNEIYSGQRRRE